MLGVQEFAVLQVLADKVESQVSRDPLAYQESKAGDLRKNTMQAVPFKDIIRCAQVFRPGREGVEIL